MLKDITFGQYYPGKSIVHHMDARAKIVFAIAYIVAVFLVNSYWGYIVLAAFVAAMIIASGVPVKSVLNSLKTVLVLILVTVVLNLLFYRDGEKVFDNFPLITYEGIDFTIKMLLRLVLLILGTSITTLTTTPMALTDGLEWLMTPLKWIKFPVHDVAIIMSIALRLIPTLVEEINKITLAQKARGAAFDTGNIFKRAKALLPILIPLFVSAFSKASDLALALDARCYNATEKRTKMKRSRFSWRDLVGVLAFAALITLIVLMRTGGVLYNLLPDINFLLR